MLRGLLDHAGARADTIMGRNHMAFFAILHAIPYSKIGGGPVLTQTQAVEIVKLECSYERRVNGKSVGTLADNFGSSVEGIVGLARQSVESKLLMPLHKLFHTPREFRTSTKVKEIIGILRKMCGHGDGPEVAAYTWECLNCTWNWHEGYGPTSLEQPFAEQDPWGIRHSIHPPQARPAPGVEVS